METTPTFTRLGCTILFQPLGCPLDFVKLLAETESIMLSAQQDDGGSPRGLLCGVVDGSFLRHLQEATTDLRLKHFISTDFCLKVCVMAP